MVPGRKTDVLDCQWLQTLHLYGLLRGSFHPEEKVACLRNYMRERSRIIKDRQSACMPTAKSFGQDESDAQSCFG